MKIAIFNPYFDSLGGGEKVTAVTAAHLSEKHEVLVLVKKPVDKTKIEKYFAVSLKEVNFVQLPPDPLLIRLLTIELLPLPGRWKSLLYDWSGLRTLKNMQLDLFINNLYQSSLPSPAPKSIYMCMFPQKLSPGYAPTSVMRKIYHRITTRLEKRVLGDRRQAINSYSAVTANSVYTAGWIKRYWQREARVVYPVCDDMGPPGKKKNIILNVGRFFADNGSSHHKKQHELVKAFIALGRDDWELHLAGSVASDADTETYMSHLKTISKGHSNIHVHGNAPLNELKKLYRAATLYWHATGLGYSQQEFPENQEHFGISTVEAMSAGVVPVVINSAGQSEVVEHGHNGLLWSNIKELVSMSNQLIDNPNQLQKLSQAAVKSSTKFGRQSFLKTIDQLILDVCDE